MRGTRADARTGVEDVAEPAAKEQEGRECELERANDPGSLSIGHVEVLLYVRQRSEKRTEIEGI